MTSADSIYLIICLIGFAAFIGGLLYCSIKG